MYRFFAYAILCFVVFTANGYSDVVHQVRKGETLSEIAKTYRVTVSAIKTANNITNANNIKIGQKLKIPGKTSRFIKYKVRRGDSLSSIANKNGITLRELSAYNNIGNADKIKIGEVIRIPIRDGSSATGSANSALSSANQKVLAGIKPTASKWKHIVIHHSGSKSGSAKAFDRFHRVERHMENGLAYHFVIGNGNGMEDGEVHIGDRWKRQIQGGHLSSFALNEISIGICLVGDFERTKPTKKQMEQLEALVEYLMTAASVPASRVTTHTLIHPKHTACPGRNFPIAAFKKSLR